MLLLIVLLLSSPLSLAGDIQPDPALEARVSELAYKLRCLVCENQSIAESNAPLVADLRGQVREQFQAGKREQEVIVWLTERYGDYVLYNPPFKPMTLLLWCGLALLLMGLGGLFAYLRRWQRELDTDYAEYAEERDELECPAPEEGEDVFCSLGKPQSGASAPLRNCYQTN
ncbi:hypothetical protein AGMMS50256_37120 [Betaproteobacteria bacterium]|nr:hypothetical protein AGMMS50256_37120 [Betaproteobacteria bacterium]